MTTALPFQPAELEEALRKMMRRDPITRDERALVLRTLDETPVAPANEEAKVRRFLGLAEGDPIPADILAQMAWREANVDNPDPVLSALARAPVAEEPLPPEVRAELDQQVEDLRAGRRRPIPHEEVQRALDLRLGQEISRP